jgi:TonB family protein
MHYPHPFVSLRWGLILLCGLCAALPVQSQVVTTDRWHAVDSEKIGTVDMRPVALMNENDQARAWRFELRLPPEHGEALTKEGAYLDLLTRNGPAAALDYEVIDRSGAPSLVRALLSAPMAQAVATADSAWFRSGDATVGVPRAARMDLRRMRKRVPTAPSARVDSGEVTTVEGDVYSVVEESPRLIGGLARLMSRVEYPPEAQSDGAQGRMHLRFVVNKHGEAVNPEVIRGLHPALDSAAVQAIREVHFAPGRQRGAPVPTQMTMPLPFRAQ